MKVLFIKLLFPMPLEPYVQSTKISTYRFRDHYTEPFPCKICSLLKVKICDSKRQHHLTLISNIYVLRSCNFLYEMGNYRSPNISYNKTKTLYFPLWSNPFPTRTYFETSEKEIRTVTQKQGLASAFNTMSILPKGFCHSGTFPCSAQPTGDYYPMVTQTLPKLCVKPITCISNPSHL